MRAVIFLDPTQAVPHLPPRMNDGPSGTLDTDEARVRHVLIRELETISVYEALARAADAPDVRAFFEHLAKEEKEHVAEATWLLRQLDKGQDADFQRNFSTAHFKGEVSSAPDAPAQPAAGAPSSEGVQKADLRRPYIPEDYRLPQNAHRTMYALPAPQTEYTGVFTVGPLKTRR